jgi:hypothetical protein
MLNSLNTGTTSHVFIAGDRSSTLLYESYSLDMTARRAHLPHIFQIYLPKTELKLILPSSCLPEGLKES